MDYVLEIVQLRQMGNRCESRGKSGLQTKKVPGKLLLYFLWKFKEQSKPGCKSSKALAMESATENNLLARRSLPMRRRQGYGAQGQLVLRSFSEGGKARISEAWVGKG
jgi:hypothetical protein